MHIRVLTPPKLICFLFFLCFSVALSSALVAQNTANWRQEKSPIEKEISIVAVGDLMLGSWVTPLLVEQGADYPFQATRGYLQSADVAIANLEAPFTLNGEPFEKKYNFKVPPRFAGALLKNGINLVNLANNHMLDYGLTGLLSTLNTLREAGIHYSGAGMNHKAAHRPALVSVRGVKIAFFGYSMTYPTEFYAKADSGGTAYPEPDFMSAMISTWKDSVDFVVASFHWGAEKRQTPKEYQIHFAHLAIDSGADLVIGHHPHVLQGLEIYKNRLIAYSLGNYAFGSYSQYSTDSIILKIYLREEGLYTAQCIPLNVDNRVVEFQPTPATGKQHAAIIDTLQNLSTALNSDKNIIADSGIIFGDWASFYDKWKGASKGVPGLNLPTQPSLPPQSDGKTVSLRNQAAQASEK